MAEVECMCICDDCDQPFTSADPVARWCGCKKTVEATDNQITTLVKRIYDLEADVVRLNKALCTSVVMGKDRRDAVLRIWIVLRKTGLLRDKEEFEDALALAQNLHISSAELLEVAKHWAWENA